MQSVPYVLDAMDTYGASFMALLVCLFDLVPFWPCGPAAFTSGALYGSKEGIVESQLSILHVNLS